MTHDFLYDLWTLELLVSSGLGLESAIKYIAETRHDALGRHLREALRDESSLAEGLKKAAESCKTRERRFLELLYGCVKSETGILETLRDTSKKEVERRELATRAYIKTLARTAELFLLFAVLPPILLGMLPFLALVKGIAGAELSLTLARIIVLVDLAVLVLLVLWVKVKAGLRY
jgi:hypothetical protein